MGLTILKKHATKQHHYLRNTVLWLVGIVIVVILGASCYFFQVAMVPTHKSFINNNHRITRTDPLYQQKEWFIHTHKQKWTMESASGHYRLVADYIPAAHRTTKNVVILHGFMGKKERMGEYAALFHQLGYNVLLPDARAHGQSQGKYIGYGWPERYDVRKWTNKLIAKNGADSQVVIYGTSMGGATTMMTSGIKMPRQVKAFVEDCGYTSLNDELHYEAHHMYHLPNGLSWVLIKTMSGINRTQNGFFTGEASSVTSLHHNHRPMLFIQGSNDTFGPTKMVYQNYQASRGPKQLLVVKGAKHAASYAHAPQQYQRHVERFLSHYVH